jgi:hypothetical protein
MLTQEMAMTADELRQKANDAEQARQDSWERSDTDGFLSQWAHGINAELYRTRADIADAGGVADFVGLYEGDRRVLAKMITVADRYAPWKSNRVWLVNDADPVAAKRKFIPTGMKSRVQKQLGLCERKEVDFADARLEGRGKGLSGSCWVAVFRKGDEWGRDADLRTEDTA